MRTRFLGLASLLIMTIACNQSPGTNQQGTPAGEAAPGDDVVWNHLHAWFELAKIKEVAPIQGQVMDQFLRDDTFQTGLRRIHTHTVSYDRYGLRHISDLQTHVSRFHSTDFGLEFNNRLFESCCLHADFIETRQKSGSTVDTRVGSGCSRRGLRGFVNDRYAGPRNDRS